MHARTEAGTEEIECPCTWDAAARQAPLLSVDSEESDGFTFVVHEDMLLKPTSQTSHLSGLLIVVGPAVKHQALGLSLGLRQ